MGLMLSMREILTRSIDADPTTYQGVDMRSKLEASFASYLDELGVEWVYEPEIFGPRGSGYLPDFLIRDGRGRCYVEVKPTIEQAEAAKARMLVIWETRPESTLLVVSGEQSRFYAAVYGRPWESWQERWRR